MDATVAKQRTRLGEELAETLAAAIRSGEHPRGARLPAERELMQRHDVGRAAVREAIATLALRGLVRTRPGYRPVVGPPDLPTTMERIGQVVAHLVEEREGVLNLFETRVFVEAALARQAARHATLEDVAALRHALAANRAAIGDWREFYRTDIAFHGVLYRISRNPIYPALQQAFVDWLMLHWERMPRGAALDRVNHEGHAAILEAIVARDADGAEQALRSHLAVAWEFVRSTFGETAQAPGAAAVQSSSRSARR